MINLKSVPWDLLVSLFWLGFSAAFYMTFFILWMNPYYGNYDKNTGKKLSSDAKYKRPIWHRFLIVAFGFTGLFAACFFLGAVRDRLNNYTMPLFLLGFPTGVFVAIFMKKRL